jgi:predicted transcriptional regulator
MEFGSVLAATRARLARALAAQPGSVAELRRMLGLAP